MGAGDSKVSFKNKVNQLQQRSVVGNDHEFWKEFFTTQLVVADMFQLLTPQDVRDIREKQPGNLSLLIYKVGKILNNFF